MIARTLVLLSVVPAVVLCVVVLPLFLTAVFGPIVGWWTLLWMVGAVVFTYQQRHPRRVPPPPPLGE